jgi:hypothetical protein
MTKIEISGDEAAAAIEMMGMSQPENPAEAKLKASLMSKMAAIYRAEQLAEKKAKDDKAKKTVEMISNAIAEMRTYGEGFIIVDQAPGLMDMSVVRNTNTKIIMRLPDEGDRELVGHAAGLNDAQIEELAGLEMGVATAFQSDWVEPVLVKVAKFEGYYDDAKDEFDALKAKLDHHDVSRDLERHRDEIQQLIEQDIVSHYYYQGGQVQVGLRNDKTIQEAERILNTDGEYQRLLYREQTAEKVD